MLHDKNMNICSAITAFFQNICYICENKLHTT